MSCDPPSLAKRTSKASRSDLKMLNDESSTLGEAAKLGDELQEEYEL